MTPQTTVNEVLETLRAAEPGSRLPIDPARKLLGRYAVSGQLGAGGMGAVLRVTDPDLGREMAAKVALDQTPGPALDRFLREARITGLLEHPGIPPVHELGVAPDGRVYFTMKRVEGRDLAFVIDALRTHELEDTEPQTDGRRRAARPSHGDLPTAATAGRTLRERLEVFLKVTDAVGFAHSRGVIHRDLKPSNVMVGAFGEVLVMDWGLARVIDEAPLATGTAAVALPFTTAPSATQDGTVVGTPAYMPPEQAKGEIAALDERADIYAMGALLYELLTLEPPYSGRSAIDVLAQVIAGPPPPPRERAPHRAVPWELEAVVLRAMAPDPAARYPTAAALRADVVAYLEGRRVGAARYGLVGTLATWARAHRHALVACALALAAGATALGGVAAQRQRAFGALLDLASTQYAAGEGERALDAIDRALALVPGDARARTARAALLATEAERALVGVALPAELETAWRARLAAVERGDPEQPEAPAQRLVRERQVDRYLTAVAWLDRALPPVTEALVSRRIAAGEGLAWAALLGRDYTLVRQAAGALRRYAEVGKARAARLDLAATNDRAAQVDLWRRRAGIAALDIAGGLGRDGRGAGAPLCEDYLVELAGYRHPAVAIELGRLLEEGLVQLAPRRDAAHPWSQPERDLAYVLSHALGRLRLPESVPPLARWLSVATDPALVVEAGIALCNARQPAAQEALLAARDRWGINSEPWRQIDRYLPRVPDPARGSGGPPRTAHELVARGLVRAAKGDLAGALADYDAAIAMNPRHAPAFNNRGLAREVSGNLAGALADYDQAIALDPRFASAFNNRGNVRLAQGELDGALLDFDQAIALDPRSAGAFNNRGNARKDKGLFETALEDFDRAIALDPQCALAFNNRGLTRRSTGDLDGALADYDEALTLDPRSPMAYTNRGLARQDKGNVEGALADFDAAIDLDPRDANALTGRGIARQAKGDLEGALADYDRALELDPRSAAAYNNRGLARKDQGDLDRALADYDSAITTDPRLVSAYVNRGVVRQANGNVAGALADFDQAIELDPRCSTAFANRGAARSATGDLDRALADYDQALALDSKNVLVFYNRGNARAAKGDLDGALADFDAAIATDPRYAVAFTNRGLVRKSKGDLDGALADFDAAIAITPELWQAWANRGQVLSKLGRRADAIASLERALELVPPAVRPDIHALLQKLRAN